MTHFTCMVFGEDVEGQLARYDEGLTVEPYREFVEPHQIAAMAERFGIDPSDSTALAVRCKDWFGADGGVEDGRVYYWCDYNPDSKWDYWERGGRWSGRLIRKDGSGCNSAPLADVDWEATAAPIAIVIEGTWRSPDVGWFGYVAEEGREDVEQFFRQAVAALPPSTPVTLVDCHI